MPRVSFQLLAATCLGCALLAAHARAQNTPHWTDRFARDDTLAPGGANVACLYDDGSGPQLYLGGSFTNVGGVAANRIARYDGHRWFPLLGGTSGRVEALAVFDDDGPGPRPPGLYVAGQFTTVNGGQPANRIARWDGTSWTPLDSGIAGSGTPIVETLAVFDEDGAGPGLPALFAGGDFQSAGGLTVKSIARWTGSFWSSPGGGPDGSSVTVSALHVFDDDGAGANPEVLVVGGTFVTVEGLAAKRIAQWDGTLWSGFGAGFDQGSVLSLATFDSGSGPELYVGGTFTSAETVTCYGTARWSGTAWVPMGSTDLHSGAVYAMSVWNDGSGTALFCGGAGGNCGLTTYCDRAIKWTGTAWVPLPGRPSQGEVETLVAWDDGEGENLWAAGDTFDLGGSDMAVWNGATWERPGNSVARPVHVARTFDFGMGSELVVGGQIDQAGPLAVSRIARWSGSSWHALGSGFSNTVHALASFDPDDSGPAQAYLVAGGQFTEADGSPAGRLARWSGSGWVPLTAGSGANGSVNDFAVFDEDGPGGNPPRLFATGAFASIDALPVARIGRFNGTGWSGVGGGLNGSASALLAFDEDGPGPGLESLFVAGSFATVGSPSISAPHVARWDGSVWSAVGTPLSNVRINALASFDEDGAGPNPARLFAGCDQSSGGAAVQRWDGASWTAVGPAFEMHVGALAVFDDGSGSALYAGGSFTTIGGAPIARLARWDGASWAAVGTVSSEVLALHVYDDGSDPALFGTGPVLIAGRAAEPHLSEWVGSTTFASGLASFADAVLAYEPTSGGGSAPVAPYNDPAAALAAPDSSGTADDTTCSLGHGGRLSLAFTDNRLANSGTDSPDLIVFSAGDPVERALVRARASTALTLERLASLSITPDVEGYVALGTTNGASSGIDLDALFPGAAAGELHFDAVHLRDDPTAGPTGGPSAGADIDAVGASMSVPPFADLAVTSITSSGPDQNLLTVTISFTVKNQGDLSTSSIWQDEIYRSTDAILLNGNDTLLGTYTPPSGLAPGASMTRSIAMTWPPVPGTYYLIARTDKNDIEEEGLLDANNVTVIPFVVTGAPRPDLVPLVITAPTVPVNSGSSLSVTWRVTNVGTAATDSPSWSDALFLTTSNPYAAVPPDAVSLGAFFHPLALEVGASYDITRTVTLPHDIQGGTYYICARGDSGNAMVELVEANNFAYSAAFTIDLEPQPDLVVQDVLLQGQSGMLTLFAGQSATVTWVDRNAGTGLTDVDAWTDKVWLSENSDSASVAGDILLGTQSATVGVLSGGQEAVRSLVVTLPVDVSGTRRMKVQADTSSEVSESGLEGNNIGVIGTSIAVYLSVTPDLRPTAIAPVDSTSWITGQTQSISWDVVDDDFADWDTGFSWHDQVYLSADTTLEIGTDLLLRDMQQAASFNGSTWDGVNYTKTTTVTVPVSATAGTWYLIVLVDANAEVYEYGGENNNQLASAPITISVQSPDLVMAPIASPASGAAGQPIALEWQVTNAGSVETPGASWVDSVYLSADDVFSPSTDTLVRTLLHSGALLPLASYPVSTVGTIPVVTPRGWYLIYRTDSTDVVWEGGGAASNYVAVPFTVTTQAADLVASTMFTPASVQAGHPVALTWTVANDGTLPTVRTTWTDRLYLSQDATVDGGDILLGVRMHSGRLQAGQSYADAAAYEVPVTISGLWYAIVVTDAALQEQETDETNNAKATRMRIVVGASQPANLVVDSVVAPTSGVSGQPLVLSWFVRNAGTGPTDEQVWSDSLYLSADSFLDTVTDIYLGVAEHTAFLGADDTRQMNSTPTIPLGISGSFYVIVKTDSGGAVYESGNENDNTRASGAPLPITLRPPSDLAITEVLLPVSARLGNQVAVTWTTENQFGGTATGIWRDSFYLSVDATLDPGDVLLGDIANTSGTLLVGGSHVQAASFTVRGVLPGNYRVIAIADGPGNILETDETDNQVASTAVVAIDCLEILPGQQSALSLVNGQSRYWKITAAADLTLRVRLTHQTTSAWTELYLRENAIPAPGIADVAFDNPGASAQELLFPLTHGQPIYVLARATSGVGGRNQDATLAVEVVPFQALSIAPDHAGTGIVTFDISGSNLNTLVQVQLDPVGPLPGAPLFASEFHVIDASRALAAFDLSGQPTGSYDLILTSSTVGTFTLPAAVTVEPATPPAVRVEFEVSPSIRLGARGSATATITSTGNVNAPGALLALGRAAGDDVALSVPSLWLADLETNDVLESLILLVDELGPGQSEQVELDVDVGAAYSAVSLTFGLSGRPLTALDARTFALDVIGEELRAAVLDDPTSNAELRDRAASSSVWRSAIDNNLPAGTSHIHLPGAGVRSGGALVAQVAVAAGSGLALVDQVPPTSVESVTGSLACLAFFDTAFDCLALAPAATGLEQARAEVTVSADAEPQAVSVACATPFSLDPNAKSGPPGSGPQHMVSAGLPMEYRIEFENQATALAPAGLVLIEDELEPALHLSSFRARRISFGDIEIELPENSITYQNTFDVSAERGVLLQVTAGIDAASRKAFWILQSLDPENGLPIEDGLRGFLPPNDENGLGAGHVDFSIQPDTSTSLLITGSGVSNNARIQFDSNPAVTTNVVENTFDGDAPSSSVTITPGVALGLPYVLSWSGSDPVGGAGVATYTVWAARDDEPYVPIVADTTDLTLVFDALPGSTYRFYSRAKDLTGNEEVAPTTPDVTVVVPPDCNENGVADPVDLALGTSLDCDGDLQPDECQPDADGDGAIDACDGCPADPLKIAPGICGCGVADADSDADGTADCNDGCPSDPLKSAPGQCGCGNADTDTDGDSTADCNDLCPIDPLKIAPGVCGCGVPDTDTDGDAIPDCNDNCDAIANPSQADCDADGLGDACEIAAGAPDVNLDGEPDDCQDGPFVAFCFGDSSGTACPCGNSSPVGNEEGCLNSLGTGGKLVAAGLSSLSNDALLLSGTQMPNSSALYFQGTTQQNGGSGSTFGDGLRCAGGTIVRLKTVVNAAGASQFPEVGDPRVSVRGLVTSPGTRTYQVWYRNAAAFCTTSTFNLTNGVLVTWVM